MNFDLLKPRSPTMILTSNPFALLQANLAIFSFLFANSVQKSNFCNSNGFEFSFSDCFSSNLEQPQSPLNSKFLNLIFVSNFATVPALSSGPFTQ